jgi:hypothetical protein
VREALTDEAGPSTLFLPVIEREEPAVAPARVRRSIFAAPIEPHSLPPRVVKALKTDLRRLEKEKDERKQHKKLLEEERVAKLARDRLEAPCYLLDGRTVCHNRERWPGKKQNHVVGIWDCPECIALRPKVPKVSCSGCGKIGVDMFSCPTAYCKKLTKR